MFEPLSENLQLLHYFFAGGLAYGLPDFLRNVNN